MTAKSFFNKVTNGSRDILEEFLALLHEQNIHYCVIGGLAVNAYAEPVISLDFDVVIAVEDIDRLLASLPSDWTTKKDRFSINISTSYSDLRIQIQTDSRYNDFVLRGVKRSTMGYGFQVARIEDVLQGKIWAYLDPERRDSKRLKDLSDMKRLVESHPELLGLVPEAIREKFLNL